MASNPSAASPRRRFIVRLPESYQIPKEWDPIRVLAVETELSGTGGNYHKVYVCLCEEVEHDA